MFTRHNMDLESINSYMKNKKTYTNIITRLKCTSSLRAQQSNPEKIIFHFKRGIV